jgi:hypothetical protein
MISKRIPRKKQSDARQLICYIVDAENKYADRLWMTAEEYAHSLNPLMIEQNRGGGAVVGEDSKLAGFRITNCEATVPGMAIAEMIATQKKNTRSKTDKLYHLVVSFPEEETPTPEQFEDIEREMCAGLGFAEHQRVSAIHQDTKNLHLHVVINKVHPQHYRCLEPYHDYQIRDRICERLEEKHGLVRDNHGRPHIRGSVLSKVAEMENYTGTESLLRWVRGHALDDLRACYERGGSWQNLHDVLGRYDLEIRPRGAGLVIAERGGPITVKASSVDRLLSMNSLTERFGGYVAPRDLTASECEGLFIPTETEVVGDEVGATVRSIPQNRYRSERTKRSISHPSDSETSSLLYQAYRAMIDVNICAKREAREKIRVSHRTYIEETKAWYADRIKDIKRDKGLSGEDKKQAYRLLFKRKKADFFERKQLEAQQRAEVNQLALLTWEAFLVMQAMGGDKEALGVLRKKNRKNPSFLPRHAADNFLADSLSRNPLYADGIELTRPAIRSTLKHHITLAGDIIYGVEDGGIVVDEKDRVCVERLSQSAAFLALTLAEERFYGKPLILSGSEEFKQNIVLLAVTENRGVIFADAELEEKRQYLLSLSLGEKTTKSAHSSKKVVSKQSDEREQPLR